MAYFQLTTSVRTLNRLQQIVRVLARHGFGHVVERINLGRYLPLGKILRSAHAEAAAAPPVSLGKRIASVCSELGPTFVKFAQALSTRADLASEDVLRELRKLQDQVPPFDSEAARSIIATEIGESADQCFASFDAEPFASGSIGQVYHAQTKSGDNVVVKVKRPGIEEILHQDLHILKWMAGAAEQWLPELARIRPVQIVEEFELLLNQEMDYVSEASATARFEEAFEADAHIHIPHVYWNLTSSSVLTLGQVRGESFEAILQGGHDKIDRKLLGKRLVDMYLKQFFDMRLFHADPHPGNFLISPPARIGLVDFGQIGTISDELAGQLVIIVVAMIYREPQIVVDVLYDLSAVETDTEPKALARDLRRLLDKYHGLPLKRLNLLTIFTEIAAVIRQHNVTLPRELVMVLKTLITIAGVALRLDPELDLVAELSPKVRKLVAGRFSPKKIVRTTGVTLWHLFSIMRSAPAQLRAVLRRVGKGKWQVNIRHENLDRLIDELDRSSNRLSFSIVIAAIIVGSSVVVSTNTDFPVFGIDIQWFGVAGYLVAGLLGIRLLWAIYRSGRLS
jgi:ubiquinone biosynthesis protein